MNDILKFVIENKDVLITFVIALVAVIKLTAWGKAQATALDTVVAVIEKLGAGNVKLRVANSMYALSGGAQDAIADSVAKADPKKTQCNIIVRFLRELFRI
ncbi:MAG: hypothetical protein ACYC64_14725 [Armatimonadota bacterium]